MKTYSEENKLRIRGLAYELRKKHDAVIWGVTPKQLIEVEGIDYEEYDLTDESFIKKISRKIKKISQKIKATFWAKENLVLIDESLHNAKKPFGQAHELGHKTIPEHREILYVCSEADLSSNTRKEMEFEANIFSAETLFPSVLMSNIYEEYPLSFETILHLKNLSGASIHSSAIKYVETCNRECCLLIMRPEKDEDKNGLKLKQQIWSPKWYKKYRRKIIADYQFFNENHNLSKVVFSVMENNIAKTHINIKGLEIKLNANTFYNGYLVFALLF